MSATPEPASRFDKFRVSPLREVPVVPKRPRPVSQHVLPVGQEGVAVEDFVTATSPEGH